MNNVTFVGNLTRDPEVVFGQSGKARARVSIALDQPPARDGEQERDPEFRDITVWGQQAENVGASLHKGDRVVVIGRSETYQREVQIDGEDKTLTVTSYSAQHIGPELRFATATVERNPKQGHSGGNGGGNGGGNRQASSSQRSTGSGNASRGGQRRPAPAADDSDDF